MAPELDAIIHQPVRLQIMAALAALSHGDQVDFNYLKDLLSVTDGNLGAHLLKLDEAGYIIMEKSFVARKPRTFIVVSDKGRAAFKEHVKALQAILGPTPKIKHGK